MNAKIESLWDITAQIVREVRLVVPVGDATRVLTWVRDKGGVIRKSGPAEAGRGRPDGTRFEVWAAIPVTDRRPPLVFTCADCGGRRLECVASGTFALEVLRIDPVGDHEYSSIRVIDAEVVRYQCLNCGGNVLPPDALYCKGDVLPPDALVAGSTPCTK